MTKKPVPVGYPILLFSLFALVFGLISLVNHYQFRTYAYDLGMLNHAVYSFSAGKPAYFTLDLDGRELSFFSTHFSALMFLYAPLYPLFGSYTLLLVQIAAILYGGAGIYKYALREFGDRSYLPLVFAFQFLSIWGIYSALSFDFHNNVVGAMLVPWFIYHTEKRNYLYASVFFVLILTSMEIMSVWLFFILLGLLVKNRKTLKKQYLKFEVPAMAVCLLYGITVILFVMPALQGTENNLQFARYAHLGKTVPEMLTTLVTRPGLIFTLLFENNLGNPQFDHVKLETHLMVLASGGIALLLRPAYLIMLIPVYAQKFFTLHDIFWGINVQYSVEFAPILSLALIDLVKQLPKYRPVFATAAALVTLAATLYTMQGRRSGWYNKANTAFYHKSHYHTELDVPEINKALALIEDDAVVSAGSSLVPHLAGREKIYYFPIVKDATYIVLFINGTDYYPLKPEEFENARRGYQTRGDFTDIYQSKDLLILKKR